MNAQRIGGTYRNSTTGTVDRVLPLDSESLRIMHDAIKAECERPCGAAEKATRILAALGLVESPDARTAEDVMADLRRTLNIVDAGEMFRDATMHLTQSKSAVDPLERRKKSA